MRSIALAIVGVALALGTVWLYVATRSPPRTAIATDARAVERSRDDAPTIDAAFGAGSAREEREQEIEILQHSGPADESWSGQAGRVFDATQPFAAVSAAGCYVAGCAATLTFGSERAYREGLGQIEALAGYRGWTGGKKLTSAEVRSDGSIVVGLFLFRPD